MEGEVARPELGAQRGNGFGGVLQQAPAALRVVGLQLVEELVVINRSVSVYLIAFLFLLDVSEVMVLGQVESILFGHALEGFVAADFAERRQFEGALRHSLAIVFNLVDDISKAVELGDGLGRQH